MRPLRGARLEGDVTMRKSFGLTRLRAMPAADVWHVLPSGGLYAVAPSSTATVRLDAAGLHSGDIAGLALLSVMAAEHAHPGSGLADVEAAFTARFAGRTTTPFAWLGVSRGGDGFSLIRHVEHGGRTVRITLGDRHVWLRAECDFVRHDIGFFYSGDGRHYAGIGEPCPMASSPHDTEAVWCSPFSRAARGHVPGGHADFDSLLLTTKRAPRTDDGP